MQIIDGKHYADKILADLKLQVTDKNIGFAIVLVGDNPASKIYVAAKMKRAEEIGIKAELIHLISDVSQEDLLGEIETLNSDDTIHGIIVQLPLPSHIDKHILQQTIDPTKDVDGFNAINVGFLHSEIEECFVPCTPQGCMALIKTMCPDLTGKIAVVIGRSGIVGRPMAALLLQEDATVTICHSRTKNLETLTSQADIVVSAMGKPLFLKKYHFKKDAIVIDVGITRLEDGRTVGDIDFDDIKNSDIAAITPVPGGVGPMTIAYLLSNVVKAYTEKNLI
jgi:methylenetetrahydrofolate dehydrogenase (NADP+) / methenyltetrahydrofolate cyclohydrolase